MTAFVHKIKIGNLELKNNILYAPLAGCTDFPFRKIAAHYNPGLQFCEMVKMEALIRSDEKTRSYLDYSEDMRPIGAQICGSNAKIAGESARIIEELGFDLINLNCGCPVSKVTKDGSGSAMLKTPELIGEILSEMAAAVKIPVTVKVRVGWDFENINISEVTRISKEAGAKAIIVHARTRSQGYRGKADWSHIAQAKKENDILVIGNGDIFTVEDAFDMFKETGCDGILVARGMLGKPWIAEEIVRAAAGKEPIVRDAVDVFEKHFKEILNYKSEKSAILDARRTGCWYFKGTDNASKLRNTISRVSSVEEVFEFIT